ncbi:hydroxymethylglutaryl-CoA lyase [Gilvimarinus sp. SDUM040013]|uniref:hydroxymethylglutaryl-CoA lyase n=1 Tax=Gilvimarinus gilvus TaxID=3058038 RepID=A0ABU4RVF7_9GAMM|nr:hydroxymethylglutaryl-CoA lyase [Gilvimarinus sp. SDUM040013]MDO3386814.1 hydroxymethylglutaryl-CoA lyase [Gilvimarinus sp. SDUM040013]MDX6848256.1 hydroxymethylglutaryl-CoA lyase [Gilvimarinus sp. SDUM040013]
MVLPGKATLVEVGPRDGLQNETGLIASADKIELINALARAGLTRIEAGAFVNPKWVPQMADSEAVLAGIERRAGVSYSALTPNLKGFERALAAKADEVAIFAAASEAFSQKNLNCSIDKSLARFAEVTQAAAQAKIPVRGYISCVLGCPYSGAVDPALCVDIAEALFDMGCFEVSLGDTIGVGTAASTQALLTPMLQKFNPKQLAVHMHDTYGQALANVYQSLQMGISVIDASVAGLGGCPYAKGASGNLATEDVLYLLNGLGIEHGIDLNQVVVAGDVMCRKLGIANHSRVAQALLSQNA